MVNVQNHSTDSQLHSEDDNMIEDSVGRDQKMDSVGSGSKAGGGNSEKGTKLLPIRQEMALVRANEHVAYLQESLSALSATGAEIAALLNRKNDTYNALLFGLKELLTFYAIEDAPDNFIETSAYYVSPQSEEIESGEVRSHAVSSHEDMGSTTEADATIELPDDVNSILGKVEYLARSFDADQAGREKLVDDIAERENTINQLNNELDRIRTDLESKAGALSDNENLLQARNEEFDKLRSKLIETAEMLEGVLPEQEDESIPDESVSDESVSDESVSDESEELTDEDALEDARPEGTAASDVERLLAAAAAVSALIRSHSESLRDLATKLDGTRGELQMTLAVTEDVSVKLRKRDEELAELKAKAKALNEQLDTFDTEPDMRSVETTSDSIADTSDEDTQDNELDALRSRIERLVQILQDKDQSLADTRSSQSMLQQRIASLESTAEINANESREIDEMIADLKEMLVASLSDDEVATLKQTLENRKQEGQAHAGNSRVGVFAALIATAVSAVRKREKAISIAGEDKTTLHSRLSTLEDQLQQQEIEKEKLDSDYTSLQEEAEKLRSEQSAKEEEHQELTAKLTELQEKYDVENVLTQDQQAKLAELRSNIGETAEQLRAELSEIDPDELESANVEIPPSEDTSEGDEVAAMSTGVAALIALLRNRKETISNSTDSIATLQDRAGLLENQNASLQTELAGAKSAVTAATSKSEDLQAMIDSLTNEKSKLDDDVSTLSSQLDGLKESLAAAEQEQQSLASQLSQAKEDQARVQADYESRLAEKSDELDTLSSSLDESSNKLQNTESALQDAQERVATLEGEVARLEETVRQTQAECDEKNAELAAASSKLATYESELIATEEERDALLEASPVRMVTVTGTWQGASDVHCDEWDPACEQTRLRKRRDGTYRAKFSIPQGKYLTKVAINGSWDENYGVRGELDGPPIKFEVGESGEVTFSYDPDTHILTIV